MNEHDMYSDCLELLRDALGCTYISDLRVKPYNDRAKLLLKQLKLEKYSLKQIADVFEYIYGKDKNL